MEGVERSVSPSHLPDPCSAPWYVCLHGKHVIKSQTFFSLTKRRFYVRSIQEMRQHYCMVTSFGWFLMLDETSLCFFWNPFTMARVELPSIPHGLEIYKCILSSPPNHHDCMVDACFNLAKNYVMFCRPGDKTWICHNYHTMVKDVVSCKGKFYGITPERNLVIFNFDSEPVITILDIFGPGPARLCFHDEALLESCGEIFLVDRFIVSYYEVTGDIQVLKLDLSNQRWDEVDHIGDKVFFLNSSGCSESLTARG